MITETQPDLILGREALLAGDPHGAVQALLRAVAAAPGDVEARYWLASAEMAAGDTDGAGSMDNARTLHALLVAREFDIDLGRCQTDPAYANAVASELYAQKLVAVASVIRAAAISAGAADVPSLLNYGLSLQHQGRIEEASRAFEGAAKASPSPAVQQFTIYPQVFRDDGDTRHLAAARAWARRHAPIKLCPPNANPEREGRRLRIGYLAPRFAGCQLEQFMAPLLERHDPTAVDITLYPNQADTETRWPGWIKVHPIGGLDDAAAAAQIRSDWIDVLADCWGHTAGSRLALFAHRPAPVQVAWINFIQSTGLEQADYVLHADCAEPPPGLAELYAEQIWSIGPVFNAFRPAQGRPPPLPSPALKTGRMTFGSFNHPAKLSDQTLDAWAGAMRRAPRARLLLRYGYFIDPVLRRTTQARLAARGVAPERVDFAGHASGYAYLDSFAEVDLMLDAWPAPGSTTTLDALSNGVPVLAMAGPTIGGMYARAMLEACGLPELICQTPDEFVARAAALATDILTLNRLRARVRPGFDDGPICDEAGFTHRVEAAFAGMFDLWRARSQDAA